MANLQFRFDIAKVIASVAYLAERNGGELDMFLGLKSLYLADKMALTGWGRPITGDQFRALPKGPVLKTTYCLFKGTASASQQALWNAAFTERVNQKITQRVEVNGSVLSDREREVLAKAQDEISQVAPWDVADWLHQTCPEWRDPNGSFLPIHPEDVLRGAGRTDEEIAALVESEFLSQQIADLIGA